MCFSGWDLWVVLVHGHQVRVYNNKHTRLEWALKQFYRNPRLLALPLPNIFFIKIQAQVWKNNKQKLALVLLSAAVTKYHNQKQLAGGKALFQELQQKPWTKFAYWLTQADAQLAPLHHSETPA